jgi:D-glycero-D-manno-heptose 1,7-bisphosphate phosphatase
MSSSEPDAASDPGLGVKAVFLDRDGTLNVKPPAGEYVERPSELRLLPGAAEGVRMLREAGRWTVVVTNQRGVALGRMNAEDLDAVHVRLEDLLAREGAALDGIYACTHGLGECNCRKPEPGLLLAARKDNPQISFSRSAIVGDSRSDMEGGRRLGLLTVLVASAAPVGFPPGLVDHVVADLVQAAEVILRPPVESTANRWGSAG